MDPTLYDLHNKKGIAYKHLAVLHPNSDYNQKAMQEFDLALSKNDKSVLAYSNKAQLHFQFDQHDLANQNITKSIQLLDQNQASEQLDSPQKKFIKSGINHINRIENKFYDVANQVI